MQREGIGRGTRVQLHRAISKLGLGSRAQACQWIRAGKVYVDGRSVTDPLTWVDWQRQAISLGGREAGQVPRLVMALNKPAGVVTTRKDERGRTTVYDLLPADLPWLFPVGRLDADSEGLLILTNDSRLAVLLTEPEHHIPKTYHVSIRGLPSPEALERLRKGVELKDGMTRPAKIRLLEPKGKSTEMEIVLTEGRNRQVRRMCAAVGHKVTRLRRVAIGAFLLADLPTGVCRVLSAREIRRLGQSS